MPSLGACFTCSHVCVCARARARVCVCVPAHGGDGEGWWFVGGDLAAEEKRLVANWHAVQLGPILRDADESGLPRQRREAWQSKPRRHRARRQRRVGERPAARGGTSSGRPAKTYNMRSK